MAVNGFMFLKAFSVKFASALHLIIDWLGRFISAFHQKLILGPKWLSLDELNWLLWPDCFSSPSLLSFWSGTSQFLLHAAIQRLLWRPNWKCLNGLAADPWIIILLHTFDLTFRAGELLQTRAQKESPRTKVGKEGNWEQASCSSQRLSIHGLCPS